MNIHRTILSHEDYFPRVIVGSCAHAIKFAIYHDMAKVSKLRLLQLRRRSIQEEITRHKDAISSLESKLSEYEITERVLASLGDDGGDENQFEDTNQEDVTVTPSGSAIKPKGLPTMPTMIIESLQDARTRGQKGLEPKEMGEYIEKKYWPGMPLHIVGPTAWRMHKDGRLAKRESRYFLVQNDEGSDAQTSEPSTSESGAGGGPRGAASHPSPAGSTPVGSTRRRDLFASTAIPTPYGPPKEWRSVM